MTPEEINKKFNLRWETLYGSSPFAESPTALKEFIRQSLIQLLDHVKEEMPKRDDTERIERFYGLRYVNGEDKWGDAFSARVHQELYGRNTAIDDCLAVIERIKCDIELCRPMTDGEKELSKDLNEFMNR